MAALTWKNVDAPNFSGVNASLATASQLLSNSTSDIGKAIDRFKENRRQAQTGGLLKDITQAHLNGADPSAILASYDGADVSPEAWELAMGLNQRKLNEQSTSASIANTNLNMDRTRQTMGFEAQDQNRKQTLWGREDNKFRAQAPALARALEIKTMLDSGDTGQIARAKQLQVDSSDLFSSAGMTYADANQAVVQNREMAESGMQFQRTLEADRVFWENDRKGKDLKGALQHYVSTSIDGADAKSRILNEKGIPEEMRSALLGEIGKFDGNYPEPSKAQQLQANPVIGQGRVSGPANAASMLQQADTSSWLQYNNRGSKRSLDLDPRLVGALSFLPELGVRAVVTSGGQSSEEEFHKGEAKSNGRTGSVRHDHGGAGDFNFYQGDRLLSWEKASDVPILQEISRRAKANGAVGQGAGADYMGDTTTHIGFGTEAVWGSKGGKPYAALAQAFGSAQAGNAPPAIQAQYKAAADASADGQDWSAPIDTTRPRLQNEDGTVSTEKTITTEMDGAFVNIPTIFDGKEHSEEEAIQAYRAGQNPAVGVFREMKAAEAAAEARTAEIGKAIEQEQTAPQAAQVAPAAPVQVGATDSSAQAQAQELLNQATQNVTTPTEVTTPTASVVDPAQTPQALLEEAGKQAAQDQSTAQAVLDVATVDRTLNTNESLVKELTERPNRGESKAQTIDRLLSETSPLRGLGRSAVTAALEQTIEMSPGKAMEPDMAAALLAESVENRDLRGPINQFLGIPNLFGTPSDEFGPAEGGSNYATRIDMENVQGLMNGLFRQAVGPDGKPTGQMTVAPAVSQMANQRLSSGTPEQATKLTAALQQSMAKLNQIQLSAGRIGPERAQALIAEELQVQAEINRQLEAVTKAGGAQVYMPRAAP